MTPVPPAVPPTSSCAFWRSAGPSNGGDAEDCAVVEPFSSPRPPALHLSVLRTRLSGRSWRSCAGCGSAAGASPQPAPATYSRNSPMVSRTDRESPPKSGCGRTAADMGPSTSGRRPSRRIRRPDHGHDCEPHRFGKPVPHSSNQCEVRVIGAHRTDPLSGTAVRTAGGVRAIVVSACSHR